MVWQAPALAAARRVVFALPLVAAVAINVHRSGVMLTGIAVAVTLAGLLARSDLARRVGSTTGRTEDVDSAPPLTVVVVVAVVALACGALLLNPAGAFGVLSTVPGVGGWQADLTLVEEWRQLTLASLLVDTPTAAVLLALASWTAVRRASSPAHLLVFALALPFASRAFFALRVDRVHSLAAAALGELLMRAGTKLRAL